MLRRALHARGAVSRHRSDQVVPDRFCQAPKPSETLQCPAISGSIQIYRASSVDLTPEDVVAGVAASRTSRLRICRMPTAAQLDAYFRGQAQSFVFRVIAGPQTSVTLQLSGLRTFTGATEVVVPASSTRKILFWNKDSRWGVLV